MSALGQKRTWRFETGMSAIPSKADIPFIDASIAGNISGLRQINTSSGNLLSVEESMIDAVLNIAVFAALVLCIVGFSAWARKRVP
jgi:hypothetical protein